MAAGGSFQFRHPTAPGVLNLAGMTVDGAASGESLAAATYTLPAVRKYDFNGPSNATATGYIGVRGQHDLRRGAGATAGPRPCPSSSGRGPDALRRDGHYGARGTHRHVQGAWWRRTRRTT